MKVTLDENDPCGTYAKLSQAYADLVMGNHAQEVTFRGGPNGVERTVVYGKADPTRFRLLMNEWDQKCAVLTTSRPRRYAANASGRLGPQWGWPFGRTY